jgi:uncharacterized protein (DUF433 family)
MPAIDRESINLWRERIHVPAYRVVEAARYARTSTQTVGNWQMGRGNRSRAIAQRDKGASLSYLQLIEVGVVAAMRKAGVTLPKIREAREYLEHEFKSKFPFAEYRFNTDGKALFVTYDQMTGSKQRDKLLCVTQSGQLAWKEILSQRLQEFEYDTNLGKVVRWKVGGVDSPVRVDPRVSFGAPQVNGIATWVLRERWKSGESLDDIADDYDIKPEDVEAALRFEDVDVGPARPNLWPH